MTDQASLPTGTVTFLFTDVEGSTRLWEDFPDAAGAAMARHDQIIEDAVEACSGAVVRPRGEGDSRFCVFARASDGVAAALSMQRALAAEGWQIERPVKVRIGIHTGEADLRAGDYYGTAVNRCARIRGVAHGGQTLVSRATEELSRDALARGITLRDLGAHRLRDVAELERLFQLCHPDLADDFGPLLSLDERRNNLPSELSSFIGREQEVHDVKKLLIDARLVTLHGAAGCGKTRLALEVADELIGAYADGVWFVELAAVSDPALIADALATAIGFNDSAQRNELMGEEPGVGPHAGAALRARLIDHLRARQVLLVIDNCEHLVAATADLVDEIMRAAPDASVLATSRESLGLASELAWKVPSLSVPDLDDMPGLEALSQFEAFKLFVERARQRRTDFEVNADEAPAIAQICVRLDGIPLALELAAARAKLLSPTQIAARLDERFRLLVGGSRTALERQQTLRATVDWSYEPLTDPERALFRRLAVFAGGFTLDAVEVVCVGAPVDDLEVLDLLEQLVDKSLVEADSTSGGVRYRMLETFRQYAREKLFDASEGVAYRARHRDHFLALAERDSAEKEGPRMVAILDRLEVEHDNLRSALEWSVAEKESGSGPRLVAALWAFWMQRGHVTEGRGWCRSVLDGREEAAPAGLRCDVLRAAAILAFTQFDLVAARPLMQRWIEAAESSGDAARLGHASLGRGLLPFVDGDFVTAKKHWTAALDAGRDVGDSELVSNALQQLARVESYEGNREKARAILEEILDIARASRALATLAETCAGLAVEARASGDFAGAQAYLEEGMRAARELGDRTQIAQSLLGMATQARATGDLPRARQFIDEGRTLKLDAGFHGSVWRLQLAKVEEVDRNFDQARALYQGLLEESRREHVPGLRASAMEGLARVDLENGVVAQALDEARAAVRSWVEAGLRASVPDSLVVVARCLVASDRAERAIRLFAATEALRSGFGQRAHPTDARQVAADIGRARAGLDPEVFEAAWEVGGRMSLEESVALALEQHPASQ